MTRIDKESFSSAFRPTGSLSTAVILFERQILFFPLLVVTFACTSFLFGGTCAAWQWWTAVVAVVAVPFVRKERRRAALGAAGLFALLLFALRCLIPPLVWDGPFPSDMQSCHLPMVQLLIEGWNPVSDPGAERVLEALGLNPWGMAHLHVAFSMKALAVFSAVAFKYVGDPFALTFPLPLFLWLDVFLCGIRIFRGFARWAVVATLVFILPMVARQMPVDLALAFASCGLLFAMQDALRRKKCDWLALAVWGAWMANLKLNGVLGLAVFAAAFAVAKTRKERDRRKAFAARFAIWCAVLSVLTAVVSWNPLGTSWRRYGHPLYPYRTVDAERFPILDLAWDMQLGNGDLRRMGRTARFAHAYLSPVATVAFLRWELESPDFDPECEWWRLGGYLPDAHVRFELWLTFFFLLLLPAGRPWGIGGIVLLFLVPLPMIGYTRYQPWLSALGCLAVAIGTEWAETRLGAKTVRILSRAALAGLCVAFCACVARWADCVECKARELETVRKEIRPNFAVLPGSIFRKVAAVRHFVPRLDYLAFQENRCRLLVKERGVPTEVTSERERRNPGWKLSCYDERDLIPGGGSEKFGRTSLVEVAPSASEESTGRETEENLPPVIRSWTEEWTMTPFGYYVPNDDDAKHIHAYSGTRADVDGEKPQNSPGFVERTTFVLRAWFVTYPREVLRLL